MMMPGPVRVGLGLLTACILCFIAISLRAISRTKRTPRNTRFLTKGMLVLDFIGVSTVIARMFLEDKVIEYEVIIISYIATNTSFITVALMCVERIVLCQSPLWYTAYFKHSRLRVVAVCIWIIFPLGTLFLRYVVCLHIIQSLESRDMCASNLGRITSGNIYIIILVAYICYFRIFVILRKKKNRYAHQLHGTSVDQINRQSCTDSSNALDVVYPRVCKPLYPNINSGNSKCNNSLRSSHISVDVQTKKTDSSLTLSNHDDVVMQTTGSVSVELCGSRDTIETTSSPSKSRMVVQHVPKDAQFSIKNRNTYLVFAYLVTMTIALISVVLVSFVVEGTGVIQFGSIIIVLLNGTIDPCMYVLWFKECKLELMKMMAVCRPSLYDKAELRRIQIYDIVTAKHVKKI